MEPTTTPTAPATLGPHLRLHPRKEIYIAILQKLPEAAIEVSETRSGAQHVIDAWVESFSLRLVDGAWQNADESIVALLLERALRP